MAYLEIGHSRLRKLKHFRRQLPSLEAGPGAFGPPVEQQVLDGITFELGLSHRKKCCKASNDKPMIQVDLFD